MKCTIELNQEDIRRIVADHFKVDLPYVCVNTKEQMDGYGPTEHKVYVATATIDVPTERVQVDAIRVPKEA